QKSEGKYKAYSYTDVHERVENFAAGLLKLGLQKDDRVSLLAEGQLDWVVAELGVLYCAAISVPLSIKLSEEEIIFRLKHSESKFIITTVNQLKKLDGVLGNIPSLEKIIVIHGTDSTSVDILTYESIFELGKMYLEKNRGELDDRKKGVSPGQYATICYTSGTTAAPKGIILTHRNYTANIEQAAELFDVPSYYTNLLILPWDHAFAHTIGLYLHMKYGASISCVEVGKTPMETLKNISKNIKESKPTNILSVPALAKNFRKNIEKGISDKGGMVEKLFNYGLKLGYDYNGVGYDRGKGLKKLKLPMYKLIDAIIFKKIRAGFGGRLEFFSGGGALLDIELQRFFAAIGLPMLQGYGLTEASPVISSNTMKKCKFGTSGVLAPNMELKICDEEGNKLPDGQKGEIVIKGENVMAGYWKNEEATNETIKDGWLYTGDLGYMDKDGFLMVLGRSKSLLIADDGEKFSPEGIEEAFSDNSSLIEQCMLYNNQKPYTVILIHPNKLALERIANENDKDIKTDEGKQFVLEQIEKAIDTFRTGGEHEALFPQRWLPTAVGILSEGFTEQNKLMNSTMKMVRPKITEHYADYLEYLYQPEAKKITHSKNMEQIKLLLG
ncbi:MAG: AMP-binding protein, partial [Bacteroidales bacterium]|nr:AMP-binding protein [Bacteroidales bacterium]